MGQPLELAADVTVERDGAPALHLNADGAVVHAVVPNLRAALALSKQAGMGSINRRRALAKFEHLLIPAGLIVEVLVGKHLVARIGAGVRGGLVSKLVGLPSMEIRALGILKALVTQTRRLRSTR